MTCNKNKIKSQCGGMVDARMARCVGKYEPVN